MSTLILNSLEIRNFRAFRDLKIERLDRVNLIVGKNNVGKTSLLEAVQLYASRASTPTSIWEMLNSNEIPCVVTSANGLRGTLLMFSPTNVVSHGEACSLKSLQYSKCG